MNQCCAHGTHPEGILQSTSMPQIAFYAYQAYTFPQMAKKNVHVQNCKFTVPEIWLESG